MAHLHYFAGGQANWYITEEDTVTHNDEVQGIQLQAFGLTDLFADGGELGYISIQEIFQCGGELDLHFKPQPLAEIYAKEEAVKTGVTMWQENPPESAAALTHSVPRWP